MERIREVIVVEGKYDTIRLRSVVDATIIETAGFGVFKDAALLAMLRRLAEERGLLILTDSDGAGLTIRNFLNGAIPASQMKHAYIPEIAGKERRKAAPGKAGLLGVEGMETETILHALRRAGATFESGNAAAGGCALTKTDMYDAGLVGAKNSARRRRLLLEQLGLPTNLSTNRLLEILNLAYSPAEYAAALQEVDRLSPPAAP